MMLLGTLTEARKNGNGADWHQNGIHPCRMGLYEFLI